jgi:hypothetical protein
MVKHRTATVVAAALARPICAMVKVMWLWSVEIRGERALMHKLDNISLNATQELGLFIF